MSETEGKLWLKKEVKENPNNSFTILLADYQDCIQLLFSNDAKLFEQKKTEFDKRLQNISLANEQSPWFLFAQAEIYFHLALVQFRFGETTASFFNFRKSFLQIQTNQKKYPEFAPNKMLLGVATALLGSIPNQYQWLISLFGMEGNVKNGLFQLENFFHQNTDNKWLHQEAMLYLVYIKYYFAGQQEEAMNLILSNQFQPNTNLMHAFVVANLSLNNRKSKMALPLLDFWIKKGAGNHYPILFYEMGEAMLMNINPSSISYYQQFINQSKSIHYKQDAFLKMSCAYMMQQNWSKVNICLEAIKTMPNGITDADRFAKKTAEQKSLLPPLLLEAKLLFDGGNNDAALAVIKKVEIKKLSKQEIIEYHFRLGRIYDDCKQWTTAIFHYKKTIELGKESTSYHSARACLQLGLMYEQLGKPKESLKYYYLSQSMKNKDFKQSIAQQAKAGINRLNK